MLDERTEKLPTVSKQTSKSKGRRQNLHPERKKRKRRRVMVLLIGVFAAAAFVALYLGTYSPSEGGPLAKLAQKLHIDLGQSAQPELQEQEAAPEQEEDAVADQPNGQEQSQDNVYAATMSGKIKDSLADVPERVYVPDVTMNTIDVIDPKTFQIIDHYAVGQAPYHVTPSWDMSGLYVNDEASSMFSVIDPRTGRTKDTVPAPFPYNFYYTPDGSKAIVVDEREQLLQFRDSKTWEVLGSVYIPWPGIDHLDFSKDGSYFLASSEWSGIVSKVDTEKMELVDHAEVGGLPIDVRLSPDGSVFYVANQGKMGVSVIDPETMKEVEFIPTGQGAHGLEVSRDTKSLYVSNRMEGTISVIDFKTRKITDTWFTGGTPDMMQLSPDGQQLWVAGRYDGVIYVLDTSNGKALHTIYTGIEPHGLTYFPSPGRFSLGHNGVYR